MTSLLRRPQVLSIHAIGKTTLHNRIRDGLFTPPISIGARAVAWPSNEVESLSNALIAGKSQDDIRDLVKLLIAKRTGMEG